MNITQPLQITTPDGQAIGRWRLVEISDEHDGVEPLCTCGGAASDSPSTCGHASADEAKACPIASAKVRARRGSPVPALGDLAALAFEAYNAHAGGKTWDGKPIPSWDTIKAQGSPVCGHWEAAIEAVLKAVRP